MSDFDYQRPETIIKEFHFQEINLGRIGTGIALCDAKITNFPDIDKDQTPVFIPRFVDLQGRNSSDIVREKIIKYGGKIEQVELTNEKKESLVYCTQEVGLSILESVHVTYNKPDLLNNLRVSKNTNRTSRSIVGEPGSGKSMILAALALKFNEAVFGGMDPFSKFPVELYQDIFQQFKLDKNSTPLEIYNVVREVGKDVSKFNLPSRPASLSESLDNLLNLESKDLIFMEGLSAPFQGGVPVISNHLASLLGTESTINLHTGGEMLAGYWDKPLHLLRHGYLIEDDLWRRRPKTDLYWTPENTTSGESMIGMNAKVLGYFLDDFKLSRDAMVRQGRKFKKDIIQVLNT